MALTFKKYMKPDYFNHASDKSYCVVKVFENDTFKFDIPFSSEMAGNTVLETEGLNDAFTENAIELSDSVKQIYNSTEWEVINF